MGFLKNVAPALSFIPGWGPLAAAGAELIGGFGGSGAPQQANNIGGYYQNALGQLLNSTGSPAAQQFGQQEQNALNPLFKQQNDALAAKEAAMGITGSGAAKADFTDLASNQANTLAGAIAPLYSQGLGAYGNILGAMPGAQAGAYQDALNQYYQSQGGLGNLAGLISGLGGQHNPYQANPQTQNPYAVTAPSQQPTTGDKPPPPGYYA